MAVQVPLNHDSSYEATNGGFLVLTQQEDTLILVVEGPHRELHVSMRALAGALLHLTIDHAVEAHGLKILRPDPDPPQDE
jgi:hypothetical protein